MKFIPRLVLALAALIAIPSTAALATTVVSTKSAQETTLTQGIVDVTSNYTNSTTTASDVTGLSVTVPASNYSLTGQFYRACFSLEAGKATATSGTLTVNVNGSDVTASARQIQSSAGRGSVVNCYVAARPTASAFVVKVRGVSADTNVFTVYAGGQLQVETFFFPQ